jgi:TPR repeat protein
MEMLVGLLLLPLLSGSSSPIHVVINPETTTVTVSAETIEQHADSPLTERQWFMRKALASVPTFENGVGIDEVRDELIDRNLSLLREWPGYIVVREGVPLIDLSGPAREKYLYGFDSASKLALGPLRFTQTQRKFVSAGITSKHIELLQMFVGADPTDPSAYNEFAWLLATHPDELIRNPQVAIDYAKYAITIDEYDEWIYVDTLAAAYAAAGDFSNAAKYQRRAIELNHEANVGAEERLDHYLDRRSYVSTIADLGVSAGTVDEAPDPAPKAKTIRDAAAGDVLAQWSLAAFYIGNDISDDGGTMSPGVFWMEQAALNEHPYAANEVGYCYLMALCGVRQNLSEAARWFRAAAANEDKNGEFNLGSMLAYGFGIDFNDQEATRLLAAAANKGITSGAFHVAFRFGEGVGESPNYGRSRKYMDLAASAGYGAADFLLDDLFFQTRSGGAAIASMLDREGVTPAELPTRLWTIAGMIESASKTPSETFVVQFANDVPVEYPTDFAPDLIFALVRIAAELGSSGAQRQFASYYERGYVADRSLPIAHYWQERAAR